MKIVYFAGMTVGELKNQIIEKLKHNFSEREALYLANSLLMHYLKLSKHELLVKSGEVVREMNYNEIVQAAEKLIAGEPLQYVTGEEFFYGNIFMVNKHVLIPRPETEELVDLIVKENSNSNTFNILDVGTGSGCIAVSLSLVIAGSKVVAADISKKALAVAERNNRTLGANVEFKQLDILNESSWHELGAFDIIVSNPPYIPYHEKSLMEPNVLDYEPHLALFVNDADSLIFYRKIGDLASEKLNAGGNLYFECNEFNANQVAAMLESKGFESVEVVKDINNKDRIVKSLKP
jgi:release factor glutamine methyltransferase